MQQPVRQNGAVGMQLVAFAAVYLIWGSTYLAISVAIETIPPLLMLGARFGVAGLVMYAWLRWRGAAAPTRKQWAIGTWVGSLLLGVGTGSVAWAEQYITSGMAALLVTTVPLFMVLLDWGWKRSAQPGLRTFLGLAFAAVGIVLLVDPATLMQAGGQPLLPILITLMGALAWSAGSIYARTADLPSDPFMSTAVQMTGGGVGLVIGGLLLGEGAALDLQAITWASFYGWAYLLVFGSFIAFSAYVWLVRHVAPAKVATYAYVNPIVAVALGWALLDEPVTGQMLVAIVVLVLAVVLITLPRRMAPAPRLMPTRWLHLKGFGVRGPIPPTARGLRASWHALRERQQR